jgi:hypothetical protein
MPEIRTIGIFEVRAWMAEPPSVPQAPPVTLQLGVPVIDMPAFEPMEVEPDVMAPPVASPKKQEQPKLDVPKTQIAPIPLPKVAPAVVEEEEVKPLVTQVVEALPTIPQATTVAVSSIIGVSAGLATPFLLKLIKPTVKKAAKRLQKAIGRNPAPEGVRARRAAQRALRG